jgi:hypothetical protein
LKSVALDAAGARLERRDTAVPGELRVAVEAIDRAYLGEQLRRGEWAAAGQLEQRRRRLRGPLLQLAVELDDRARERADAGDELARDTHLHFLRSTREPTPDAVKLRSRVEVASGNDEGRVELVQVPTQPLLRPPALVNEVVTMVDQQLQLPKRLLIRARPAQTRLPQRRSGDCERVDRIGLAARSTCTTLRRHQLRRHLH